MALGVVEAVKEANLKLNQDIYVVGCDGTIEAYDSIKKGEMAATIDMFPYYEAYMAAEIALRVLAGQNIPRVVWTPCEILDATNVNNPVEANIGWIDPTFQ
jgi:ribose transport system substrate-binding protein